MRKVLGLSDIFLPCRWFAPSEAPRVPCQPCSWTPLGPRDCYGEWPGGLRLVRVHVGASGELEPWHLPPVSIQGHGVLIPSAHGGANSRRVSSRNVIVLLAACRRPSSRWQPRWRAHILTCLSSSLVPLKTARQTSVGTSACTHTHTHTLLLSPVVSSHLLRQLTHGRAQGGGTRSPWPGMRTGAAGSLLCASLRSARGMGF